MLESRGGMDTSELKLRMEDMGTMISLGDSTMGWLTGCDMIDRGFYCVTLLGIIFTDCGKSNQWTNKYIRVCARALNTAQIRQHFFWMDHLLERGSHLVSSFFSGGR